MSDPTTRRRPPAHATEVPGPPVGSRWPDVAQPDHAGVHRSLSEVDLARDVMPQGADLLPRRPVAVAGSTSIPTEERREDVREKRQSRPWRSCPEGMRLRTWSRRLGTRRLFTPDARIRGLHALNGPMFSPASIGNVQSLTPKLRLLTTVKSRELRGMA
jgi:hypothetical protein